MFKKEEILSSAMCEEEIVKLSERKNTIADLMNEKRSKFDESDVETRDSLISEVETLKCEADEIENDIKELEEMRAKFAEQEGRMSMFKNLGKEVIDERKKDVVADKYDTPEYRKAWVDYVRTNRTEEIRQLTTDTDNVPVPTLFQGYVETAWEKYGKFTNLVNKTNYAGYLNIPFEASADDAVVHTEGAEAPDAEEITFGLIELKPAMIKKWIPLTDELMALAPEDFMRYIADELVYRVIKLVDDGIIVGAVNTNGKGIVGIVGNDNTIAVSKNLDFNAINTAIANLQSFDNLTVAMNPATFFDSIMGLVDLQGRPIYSIATDNSGKPAYFVNGQRIEFTKALKAYSVAGAGDAWAVVGDFKAYRLNLPKGDAVNTLVDPYTLATEDQVRMIGKLFAAGNVAKLNSFVQLNKVS